MGEQLIFFFFFNDTATTEIYPLSLHDALPICAFLPSARKRKPTRAGLLHLLQSNITFDTSSGASSSIMPACLASRRAREWRLIILTPSTITSSFSGKAFRTLPFLPLSLPAITRTVSFFLIFISQNLRSQRYYLHKIFISKLSSYRAKNASASRIVLIVQDNGSIIIKSNIRAIWSMMLFSYAHNHCLHHIALFHHTARYGPLYCTYKNIANSS